MPRPSTEERIEYLLDRTEIFDLVRYERLCRDIKDWDGLVGSYVPGSHVRTTWFDGTIEEFAAEPNTALKISGLGRAGQPWTAAANRRVVLDAIEVFGAGRAMFASNWPVDSLAADSLDTIFDGFQEIVADLGQAERRRLFRDNAAEIYRINL